jgi:hypothetical protein
VKLRRDLLAQVRIEHLWAITVMVGIFMFLNTHPIRPHDFWWHLAIGRDLVEDRRIPLVDEYSFTQPGAPYPSYHQFWLMEAFLYGIYAAGGPLLIVLTQTAMIFPAYLLLLWVCYRRSNNWRAAALGIVFAFALGFGNWNVRPQAISYLYGVLVLFSITQFRLSQNYRWLAILPVTMAFWVNSHGSFPIGLAWVGIWFADECLNVILQRRQTGVWRFQTLGPSSLGLITSLLGCMVNPRGLGFVDYLSMMASNSIVQNFILEWMPPTFNSLEGVIFFVMFLGLTVLMAVSPRRPSFYQVLTFLIFSILGLKYIRGIIWFGIALAPVVSEHLAAVLSQSGVQPVTVSTPQTRRINRLFVFMLALLAALSLPWFKPYWPVVPDKAGLIAAETPVKATQILLDQNLNGQVFHDMAFGSYMMWAAHPEYKVFVDSRIELYPPQVWDDYFTISNALYNWQEKLASYEINSLMLEPENQSRLIEAVSASPDWKLVYQDQAALIFTRWTAAVP